MHEHLQPIEDDEGSCASGPDTLCHVLSPAVLAVIIADLARQPQQRKARACIRAGFRKHIVFRPRMYQTSQLLLACEHTRLILIERIIVAAEVKAAIVTCGGLCPGLNDVVQEIVRTLYCT